MKPICIVDMCAQASRFPTSFWADWMPDKHIVEFGGDWYTVPDMPATTEPTETQCYEWVENYITKDLLEATQ